MIKWEEGQRERRGKKNWFEREGGGGCGRGRRANGGEGEERGGEGGGNTSASGGGEGGVLYTCHPLLLIFSCDCSSIKKKD